MESQEETSVEGNLIQQGGSRKVGMMIDFRRMDAEASLLDTLWLQLTVLAMLTALLMLTAAYT